jgi:hypothetical protein
MLRELQQDPGIRTGELESAKNRVYLSEVEAGAAQDSYNMLAAQKRIAVCAEVEVLAHWSLLAGRHANV